MHTQHNPIKPKRGICEYLKNGDTTKQNTEKEEKKKKIHQ